MQVRHKQDADTLFHLLHTYALFHRLTRFTVLIRDILLHIYPLICQHPKL